MIEADGAGFYGGTDFWTWDIETMWNALADHEPAQVHWTLQNSWRATHEMILTHKRRVEDYRDKLMQAWPPERNAASAMYLARLNKLIESLGETYDAAVANDTALSGAISALGGQRRELKRVYDQYKANQAALNDYAVAEREMGGTGAFDAMRPEIVRAQQEHVRLQREAAGIMVNLSTELRQASATLRTPAPFDPRRDVTTDDLFGGEDATAAVPLATGASPSSTATSPPFDGNRTDRQSSGRPAIGPILDSSSPPHIGAPPTSPTPTGAGSSQPSPISGIASPPSPPAGYSRPGAPSVAAPPGRAIGQGPLGGVRGTGPTNGVVGGTPSTAPLRQPTSGGRPTMQVNPVGGVIAGHQASMPGMPGVLAPNGRGATQGSETQARRWDPDNPWETAEGVPPVLEAPRERRIDPGPVIGMPR
ncbi:hypothetical protein [Spirilliplanes yamanashiensis]|uniref:Uncharacterized protein n=1 Tax=Spirilliplanes yamanashiensis TaxID=42233 RepID=A0A8J3Y3U6_9ACTN|nr:hypothetical protein [Spirilliplanes yamanashiensis]MDP9814140.1 hypothetical protein [Spirilliplanes yamanashiensis]GIJ00878.1 hypothetical protein Sya03_02300 [Spirilliplanes yamanashiensis]